MSYTKRSVQSASSRLSIVAPGDNPIARVCDVTDVTNVSFLELQTEANNHFRKANMKGFMQHPVKPLRFGAIPTFAHSSWTRREYRRTNLMQILSPSSVSPKKSSFLWSIWWRYLKFTVVLSTRERYVRGSGYCGSRFSRSAGFFSAS